MGGENVLVCPPEEEVGMFLAVMKVSVKGEPSENRLFDKICGNCLEALEDHRGYLPNRR